MLDIFSSKKWYNNVYYYDIYNKEIKVMNTEEFTEKARKIHGDKYNYSNVRYVNNHTKVCIICPIHGEFWQMPKLHLKGSGCPKCAAIKGGDYLRDTKEDFIKKAKKTLINITFLYQIYLLYSLTIFYNKVLLLLYFFYCSFFYL